MISATGINKVAGDAGACFYHQDILTGIKVICGHDRCDAINAQGMEGLVLMFYRKPGLRAGDEQADAGREPFTGIIRKLFHRTDDT